MDEKAWSEMRADALVEGWQELAGRIRVGGALPVSLGVVRGILPGGFVCQPVLKLTIHVADKTTGNYTQSHQFHALSDQPNIEEVFWWVFISAYGHELLENFSVDGEKWVDPHPEEVSAEHALWHARNAARYERLMKFCGIYLPSANYPWEQIVDEFEPVDPIPPVRPRDLSAVISPGHDSDSDE